MNETVKPSEILRPLREAYEHMVDSNKDSDAQYRALKTAEYAILDRHDAMLRAWARFGALPMWDRTRAENDAARDACRTFLSTPTPQPVKAEAKAFPQWFGPIFDSHVRLDSPTSGVWFDGGRDLSEPAERHIVSKCLDGRHRRTTHAAAAAANKVVARECPVPSEQTKASRSKTCLRGGEWPRWYVSTAGVAPGNVVMHPEENGYCREWGKGTWPGDEWNARCTTPQLLAALDRKVRISHEDAIRAQPKVAEMFPLPAPQPARGEPVISGEFLATEYAKLKSRLAEVEKDYAHEHERVRSEVSSNLSLREELSTLTAERDRLKARVDELGRELAAKIDAEKPAPDAAQGAREIVEWLKGQPTPSGENCVARFICAATAQQLTDRIAALASRAGVPDGMIRCDGKWFTMARLSDPPATITIMGFVPCDPPPGAAT